jgi:5-(carboxyamino)imidazole ribonucleotide mutase
MKSKKTAPQVGIIMGSDSDLDVLKDSAQILEELGVSFEITIVSAHRTPKRLYDYVASAQSRGIKVLIAGAGGAAHLPGMAAALTPLPVIGVPVKSRISIEGIDSLLSIAQMPPGIPVATVAINGSKNAGILAAQILGAGDSRLLEKIKKMKQQLSKQVLRKVDRLEKIGYRAYLKGDSR